MLENLTQDVIHTFSTFFDSQAWIDTFSQPSSWGLIPTIMILEGLLSADNALVLAIMVSHLPEKQRKKALFYGLWGAYLFRFIAIGLGTTLAQYSEVKLLGTAYLLWLSIKFFIERRNKGNEEEATEENKKTAKGFWATVISVELMDIAFSIDSILAAIAISNNPIIVTIGGMLGILMMRGVAGFFIRLIEKVPELKATAYILIALIGVKMGISVWGIHISNKILFVIIGLAFTIAFVIHKIRNQKSQIN